MVASSALGYGFLGITIVATLFTLIAFFTPSWRTSGDYGLGAGGVGGINNGFVGNGGYNDYGIKFGIVTYSCGTYGNSFAYQNCYAQWNARSEWFIVLLMIVAILFQIAALLSACIIPQATPKYYFATPILATISTVFLLLAIVIYAIKSNYNYLGSSNGVGFGGGVINPAIGVGGVGISDYYYHYGYSFWLAILSFILMFIATIVGFLASKVYRDEAIRYYNGRPNPAAATY